MNSRIKGVGIIATIYVCLSIYFFEICISEISILRPVFASILEDKQKLMVSDDLKEIKYLLHHLEGFIDDYGEGIL